MSRVIWSRVVLPDLSPIEDSVYAVYDEPLRVPRTLRFRQRDDEIVKLPDPRAQRSMNRGTLLLASAALPSLPVLKPFLAEDPFAVGLYCAIENGPPDYECAKVIANTPPSQFASVYRRGLRYGAKQFLRVIPNLSGAHLAIAVGAMGPLTVFTHSDHGGAHAIEQAEEDLVQQVVRVALVCSAFSLDDPLIAARTRRRLGHETVLCEAAAAVVLVPGGDSRACETETAPSLWHGLAGPVVALAQRNARHAPGSLSAPGIAGGAESAHTDVLTAGNVSGEES